MAPRRHLRTATDITIRQLLNHTSGIYDYADDPAVLAPYMQGDLTHVFDPREGVQIAADHGPLFAPGSQLSYSNTNYILLAHDRRSRHRQQLRHRAA